MRLCIYLFIELIVMYFAFSENGYLLGYEIMEKDFFQTLPKT